MATANRKYPEAGNAAGLFCCIARRWQGKNLHRFFCSHNASLFKGSSDGVEAQAVWIKMLFPKQALKSKVDPKPLICSVLGEVLALELTYPRLCRWLVQPYCFFTVHCRKPLLIIRHWQMFHCSHPSWETFLSFSAGFTSLHMPSCAKSDGKCTSSLFNPPSVKVRACTLLYIPFDGSWWPLSSFLRAPAFKQLELGFVCSSKTRKRTVRPSSGRESDFLQYSPHSP